MLAAAEELAQLGVAALQLTPGNVPAADGRARIEALGLALHTHHGFCWTAMRQPVWLATDCLVSSTSVHAPLADGTDGGDVLSWQRCFEEGAYLDLVLETMYPRYLLGTGDALDCAMNIGQPLAVDVSHLHIQRSAGVLSDRTLRRLLAYDRVVEVHLSANNGKRDGHRPIELNTFGLGWAKERLADGTLVVLECYMHKLPLPERKRQLVIAGLD